MESINIHHRYGAAAPGRALLLGSGAFTSVRTNRNVSVAVVGDQNAFVGLGPCEGTPNRDYVLDADEGTMALNFSSDGDQMPGDGVDEDVLSRFHNVFQICNQGTQAVCVNFAVDVPPIPEGADVPGRHESGPEEPALVFYENGNEEAVLSADESDPNLGRPLEVGGVHVRRNEPARIA